MTTRRGNPDQYLQRVGNTYYARVRVPRTLEKLVGQTHIRRSLKTGSRADANLRKHAAVSEMKAELAELRRAPPGRGEVGFTFAEARAVREQLEQLRAAGDEDTAQTHELQASSRAESLERLYGHDIAAKWFRTATATDDSLKELQEQWLAVNDYKESTNAGHRKALAELLEHLRDEDARPADVTLKVAVRYVDDHLTQRGLAQTTIRDRLVSLGGFWKWMASRGAAPASNPWVGHKVSKKHIGSRPAKRAYSDAELVKLLVANDTARGWPTYSYLPDLMVLGLFTGAREEELCSLTAAQVEGGKGHYFLNITDAKTKAGIRYVAVTHCAPLAVLKRRMKGLAPGERLFPELKPGGLDAKYSSSAVKAYGRYRRVCGVPDGTDFHSFRRNVITVLEHAGVDQVRIARFVGHKVGTMAADTYSAGSSKPVALEVAKSIRFAEQVEASAEALATR